VGIDVNGGAGEKAHGQVTVQEQDSMNSPSIDQETVGLTVMGVPFRGYPGIFEGSFRNRHFNPRPFMKDHVVSPMPVIID
jgi:hypothetical protein